MKLNPRQSIAILWLVLLDKRPKPKLLKEISDEENRGCHSTTRCFGQPCFR
jgi:hypothetical protein